MNPVTLRTKEYSIGLCTLCPRGYIYVTKSNIPSIMTYLNHRFISLKMIRDVEEYKHLAAGSPIAPIGPDEVDESELPIFAIIYLDDDSKEKVIFEGNVITGPRMDRFGNAAPFRTDLLTLIIYKNAEAFIRQEYLIAFKEEEYK